MIASLFVLLSCNSFYLLNYMINDERSKPMSNNPNDYGILLNKDIKLHRMYFKQMVNLIGI